jgi:hypothetical protein
MTSKAEQYRRSGYEALASAEMANSKKERAQLFEVAETWFKLAKEQRDREADIRPIRPAAPNLLKRTLLN